MSSVDHSWFRFFGRIEYAKIVVDHLLVANKTKRFATRAIRRRPSSMSLDVPLGRIPRRYHVLMDTIQVSGALPAEK